MEGSKQQLGLDAGERSRKRVHPWIKAAAHCSLCFVVGALAALAPLVATGAPSAGTIRATFLSSWSNARQGGAAPPPLPDIGLLLIVTVTRPDGGMEQDASLARLAHTMRHVAPPLLWIVVGEENRTATARAVHVLHGSGIMFRHLVYDAGNLTDADADAADEVNYQRNLALRHIERHRLNGVVHFAGASAVYDLRFFQQLRRTRCVSSFLFLVFMSCYLLQKHISSTLESSMLWDSERSPVRWNSTESATQDFIQFIRQTTTTDEIKLMTFPCDCSESQLMLWHLEMPRFTQIIQEKETQQQQSFTDTEGDLLT
ncbi:hypothetical protein PR202_ga23404 [Eleusine coracana subsp. coracana]|uniref:Glycosyltransferases n=1 Tax=Eleusine coracana subsp. coracana TaxID=191504 RepID=A0AAV5D6J0_ELECO|nr:hypothetical protein PR202_ga23404 [Eleusine coracana subsp. coracana]